MAFGSLGALGTGQNKTAGQTSFTITTSAVAEVGNIVIVKIATDDCANVESDRTDYSVSDSAGNTYTRAKEYVHGKTTGLDGAQVGIFYSVVTTELASSGTITISHPTTPTARAASAWEFSKGAGTTLAVEQATHLTGDAADPAAISLSSMTSREYLLLWALATEGPATETTTQDADYTSTGGNGTTGGGVATNMRISGGYRIATLTADTVDASTSVARDHVQILVAIYEVGGAAEEIPILVQARRL